MKTLPILLFAATLASAQPLEKRLAKIASRIDGVTGVAAVHIESGRRVTLNANERFPMASVYKIPISIVALRHVDSGFLTLDQRVVITPQKYHPGHSPLREEMKGQRALVPVRRLIRMMVAVSDNTASDVLMDLLGGARTITRDIGVDGIRLDRTEMEMLRDLQANGPAAFGADVRDTSTPNAMAELLVRLWNGDAGLSKSSRDLLLQFLRETSTGPNRIRAGVPAGAKVAHKTGTWTLGANDAGIIESADGKQHVVIAIFTKNGKATTEQREKVIAAVTREICRELMR